MGKYGSRTIQIKGQHETNGRITVTVTDLQTSQKEPQLVANSFKFLKSLASRYSATPSKNFSRKKLFRKELSPLIPLAISMACAVESCASADLAELCLV